MKTYKIKDSDLFHNKTLYKEGATIFLSDKEAESLKHILEPIAGVASEAPALSSVEVPVSHPVEKPATSAVKATKRRGRKPKTKS